MGQASPSPGDIPLSCECPVIDTPVSVLGETHRITALSLGNPHAVIFTEDPTAIDLPKIGSALESHPLFPHRANIEFVRVVSHQTLEMRVWERGSGETMACGTGACAAVAAAVMLGHCSPDTPVTVRMPGGTLEITCTAHLRLSMTGDAVKVYDGIYEI